jgi:hypothetical protein
MEVSSGAAFGHINTFLNPQATFVDSSGEEEIWFLKGLKDRARSLGRTVIDLPENAEQNLMWITLLDSSSLSGGSFSKSRSITNVLKPGIRSLLISSSMLNHQLLAL